MGWIGPHDRLMDCLKARADRDADGKFIVRGNITSFLGMGEEYLLGEDAEMRVDGKWVKIVPYLYGGARVTVI